MDSLWCDRAGVSRGISSGVFKARAGKAVATALAGHQPMAYFGSNHKNTKQEEKYHGQLAAI